MKRIRSSVITLEFTFEMIRKNNKLGRLQLFNMHFKNKSGTADGILHITITRNNTLLTLTNLMGNVLSWTSCKNCGFTGSQKSTEIATITTAEEMGTRAKDLQLKNLYIIFHGGTRFRNAVLRGLRRSEIQVGGLIIDKTAPYNGCRSKKKRRI